MVFLSRILKHNNYENKVSQMQIHIQIQIQIQIQMQIQIHISIIQMNNNEQ